MVAIRAHPGTRAVLVTHNITEAVLLADRVLVMTPRPGRISDVIDVPFERPRVAHMAKEPEFQELVFRALEGLHGAGDADVAAEEDDGT